MDHASLWGQILDLTKYENEVHQVVQRGMRKGVGRENSTLFWIDLLIRDLSLKTRFLRLYFVLAQEKCYVADMGDWANGVWS